MGRPPGRSAGVRQWLVLAAVAAAAWLANAGWQGVQGGRDTAQVVARARPGDIVMLSSLTCAYCTQARRWFEAQRVPFDECFIERDAACAARYRALLAPGTPTLLVRGQRQVGFSVPAVAEALARPRG